MKTVYLSPPSIVKSPSMKARGGDQGSGQIWGTEFMSIMVWTGFQCPPKLPVLMVPHPQMKSYWQSRIAKRGRSSVLLGKTPLNGYSIPSS